MSIRHSAHYLGGACFLGMEGGGKKGVAFAGALGFGGAAGACC
jgi:hypothetical protein